MSSEVVVGIIAAAASVVAAYLLYRGATWTATTSRAASSEQARTDAQDSALQAWQSLLQPHIDEVARLRTAIGTERDARAAEHTSMQRQHDAMQRRIDTQDERIEFLTIQLKHWRRLAKVMARWATKLRDQVLTLGGELPATPDELLLIQSLDDEDDERQDRG